MSEGGFHVHGPHDHELEHAAQGGHGAHDKEGGGMIAQIAVVTAIIATVGALFSYMGGATQANAGLYKNNAAIKKDRSRQPMELLSGQKHQTVAGRGLA